MQSFDGKRFLKLLAITFLVIAVAGLSTVAKHSRFHPESKSMRYLAESAKMNVPDVPVFCAPMPAYAIEGLATFRPELHGTLCATTDQFLLPQIGLTISLQHRSPPSLLA